MKSLIRRSLACALLSFFLSINCAFAVTTVNDMKPIDKAMLKKVSAFLVKKGHSDIIPTQGKIGDIKNGHFMKVDAVEKGTNKPYYIEILCDKGYSQWSLIACIEASKKQPLADVK